jgi:ABC-type phosphate/phosphonate transport system substrate-binding protein
VTIAADVPSAVADAITQALLDLVHSEEGRQAMYDIYNIEDLVPASDSDYDSVREMSGVLDLDLEKQVRRE